MTDSDKTLSRRQFVSTISGSALATLSGCTTGRPKQVNKKRYTSPQISISDRWEMYQNIRRARVYGPLGIYIAGSVYTDQKLNQALTIVPGKIDKPLSAFFGAQVNLYQSSLGGDLLYGVANSDRVLNKAMPALERALQNKIGIGDLENAASRHPQPERSTAHQEMTGTFPISRVKEIKLPNGETNQVELNGALPVRIIASCWRISDSEDHLIVGGAYPESSQIELRGSLTGRPGAGIDVTVNVDLGIRPENIRKRIVKQASNVTDGSEK